jgi:hypothetical protein
MTKEQIQKRVLELAEKECKRQGIVLHSTEGSKIKQKIRNDFLKSEELRKAEMFENEARELRTDYIHAVEYRNELKKQNIDEFSKEGRELKRRIYAKAYPEEYIRQFFGI